MASTDPDEAAIRKQLRIHGLPLNQSNINLAAGAYALGIADERQRIGHAVSACASWAEIVELTAYLLDDQREARSSHMRPPTRDATGHD